MYYIVTLFDVLRLFFVFPLLYSLSTLSLTSLHSSSIALSGLCDNILQDIINNALVLPNRITIPLVGEAKMAQLRFPIPKVHLQLLTVLKQHVE